MASKSRIKDLIVKKLLGRLSPGEHLELEEWADESAKNRHFLDVRMNPTAVRKKINAILSTDTTRLDQLLEDKITKHLSQLRRSRAHVCWLQCPCRIIWDILQRCGRKLNK